MALEFSDACGSVALLPFTLFHPVSYLLSVFMCGWLLEGLARESLSPETRVFTAVQASLGVHAIAKAPIALVVFQYACVEEVLKG